jgi:hypothetical protein
MNRLFALCLFAAAGCAGPLVEGSDGDQTVIGHIQTRSRTLTFHHGTNGPRFTVTDADGQVIAANLDLAELRATQPELYHLYNRAQAHQFDATLNAPEKTPDHPAH